MLLEHFYFFIDAIKLFRNQNTTRLQLFDLLDWMKDDFKL
jgi:hypothetical protein